MKKQWFAHDPENGAIFFSTENEAKAQADEWLESYKECANTDGWHELVDEVCYGKVTHAATAINLTQRPEELDEDGCDEEGTWWDRDVEFTCDYEIQPVTTKGE